MSNNIFDYLLPPLLITLTVYVLLSSPCQDYLIQHIPNKTSRLITILFVIFLIAYIVNILTLKNKK